MLAKTTSTRLCLAHCTACCFHSMVDPSAVRRRPTAAWALPHSLRPPLQAPVCTGTHAPAQLPRHHPDPPGPAACAGRLLLSRRLLQPGPVLQRRCCCCRHPQALAWCRGTAVARAAGCRHLQHTSVVGCECHGGQDLDPLPTRPAWNGTSQPTQHGIARHHDLPGSSSSLKCVHASSSGGLGWAA